MKDGIYKADFVIGGNRGFGVAILDKGSIKGGDSATYYKGTYVENGDDLTAQILIQHHTSVPDPLFGISTVNLNLTGKRVGDKIEAVGKAQEAPTVSFAMHLTRLSD